MADTAQTTIKVTLNDKAGHTLHPETDWSVIQNRPLIYDQSYTLNKPKFNSTSTLPIDPTDPADLASFGIVCEVLTDTRDGVPPKVTVTYSFFVVMGYYEKSKNTDTGNFTITSKKQKVMELYIGNLGQLEWGEMGIFSSPYGVEYSDDVTHYSSGRDDYKTDYYFTHLLKF